MTTEQFQFGTWYPIESAPKDGTPVLAFADGDMTTVAWHGYWNLCQSGMHADDGEWWPTHWMPLPPPPALEET